MAAESVRSAEAGEAVANGAASKEVELLSKQDLPAGEDVASLVATLTRPLPLAATAEMAAMAAELEGVEWLEVRADLVGDLDPGSLRQVFAGKLLYTLRSRAEGGGFDGSAERRRRRLFEAAERYDRIDLELARDLTPELLTAVPAAQRVISWHGPASDLDGLSHCFGRMAVAAEAALYKLVPAAAQPGEALAPLQLLHQLGRSDVVAFASGAAGVWTRLLAPRLGAPVVYAALGDVPGAPGQPTLRTLRQDFGLPALPPISVLFGIVGNPVGHSLSPRLHNGAYRELGIPALYLPFHAAAFGDFWLEVVEGGVLESIGLPLHGLSVTAPFKAAALAVAGAESPLAGLVGAANTLLLRDGVWEAESTDPEGVVEPLLERRLAVAGRRAVVVGAGGGGRSAAVGLARAGAEVTLCNRSVERGKTSAADLGLTFLPLADLVPGDYDILVNATSLGRAGDGGRAGAGADGGGAAAASGRPGTGDGAGTSTDGGVGTSMGGGGGSSTGDGGRGGEVPLAAGTGASTPTAEPLPFSVTGLRPGAIVLDLVYRQPHQGPTPLLRAAAAQGATPIDGREILLGQALGQFRLMTGRDLPTPLARRLLGLPPAISPASSAPPASDTAPAPEAAPAPADPVAAASGAEGAALPVDPR